MVDYSFGEWELPTAPSDEWLLRDDKNRPICSFVPEVLARVNVHKGSSVDLYVKLRLTFQGAHVGDEVTLPISDLKRGKDLWLELDGRCRFHPEFSPAKASRHLEDKVRAELADAEEEEHYHIDRLGIHKIEDTIVFCAGDRLILPPGALNEAKMRLAPLSQRLVIDTDRYTEEEAVLGALELINLYPDAGSVEFAHNISGIMRTAYMAAGITPCTVLKVVGETNSFKTIYTSLLTKLYDRDVDIRPESRLDATPSFVEELLHKSRDCTVVLDDAHPASNKSIVSQNEATLEKIIRQTGDNKGRGKMKGGKSVELTPMCNVIVTGEYAFGKGSTATRMLVVGFTETIDSVALKKCQDHPLLMSTFYYRLIEWYVVNYEEIVEILRQWLDDFRGQGLEGIRPRLNDTYFCLNTAFALFLQYCFDKDYVSKEDAEALQADFRSHIQDLVYAQNRRIDQEKSRIDQGRISGCRIGKSDNLNYFERIRQIYKSGDFIVADNAKQYAHGYHDGIIHRNCLCFRGEKLEQKVQQYSPDANIKDIADELSAIGALITGKDCLPKQISACGGKRFYFVPLSKLQQ